MDELSPDDVEELARLKPKQRCQKLGELGPLVAAGISDEAVASRLAALAENESLPEVRDSWITYICASRSPLFIPVLERWLCVDDESERGNVVLALKAIYSERTNQLLISLIKSDPSRMIRRRAIRALVRRGTLGYWDPESCDLFEIVDEPDWIPVTRREYLRLIS